MDELVNTHESESVEDTVFEIITNYALRFGAGELEALPAQPPHYVYKTEDGYVFKIHVSAHPEVEFEDIEQQVEVIRKLYEHGAKVMDFITAPQLQGNMIITTSTFFPEKLPQTAEGYSLMGSALASLHNAGLRLKDDFDTLTPLDPLADTWQCFRYLRECDNAGHPFMIGATAFPQEILQPFEEHLTKAQTAYDEMMQRAVDNDRLTTLCQDVHPGNLLLDKYREPRIIDLINNLVVGPPEYDLARPSAHWVDRFGRDPQLRDAFLDSYSKVQKAEGIDADSLKHAIKVSNIHYATSMLKDAVNAHKLGRASSDEWRITEVVNRILSLDDPNQRWKSTVDYMKR